MGSMGLLFAPHARSIHYPKTGTKAPGTAADWIPLPRISSSQRNIPSGTWIICSFCVLQTAEWPQDSELASWRHELCPWAQHKREGGWVWRARAYIPALRKLKHNCFIIYQFGLDKFDNPKYDLLRKVQPYQSLPKPSIYMCSLFCRWIDLTTTTS